MRNWINQSNIWLQSKNFALLQYIPETLQERIDELFKRKDDFESMLINEICKLITLVDASNPLDFAKLVHDISMENMTFRKRYIEERAADYLTYPEDYQNSIDIFAGSIENELKSLNIWVRQQCLDAVEEYISWISARFGYVNAKLLPKYRWKTKKGIANLDHKIEEIRRQIQNYSNKLRIMASEVKEIWEINVRNALKPSLWDRIILIMKLIGNRASGFLPRIEN